MAALVVILPACLVSAQTTFQVILSGTGENPPNGSPATGFGTAILNAAQTQITVDENWSGLLAPATASHIHGPGGAGTNAAVLFPFSGVSAVTAGAIPEQTFSITATQVGYLFAGYLYMNIHTSVFPGGEIRGQLILVPTSYTLTVTTNGNGSISPGTGSFVSGSNVVVTATPNPGYAFTGWSGAATGTNNPVTVNMSANKAITGSFNFATNSVPAAIALTAQISWFASNSVNYQVQSADVLNSNVWLNLGGQVSGNGATNYYYDRVGGLKSRFYRVMTRP